MVRCDEFYEKVEKDGNFCGMRADAYRTIIAYRDLLRRNPTIAGLTEGAARVLIAEKMMKFMALVKSNPGISGISEDASAFK